MTKILEILKFVIFCCEYFYSVFESEGTSAVKHDIPRLNWIIDNTDKLRRHNFLPDSRQASTAGRLPDIERPFNPLPREISIQGDGALPLVQLSINLKLSRWKKKKKLCFSKQFIKKAD